MLPMVEPPDSLFFWIPCCLSICATVAVLALHFAA